LSSTRNLTAADLAGTVDDVREQTLSGIRWLVYARAGVQFAGLASSVIVARLVPPAEFGRAAIALAVFALGSALCNEGFGSALVQRTRIGFAELRTAAFLGLLFALPVTAVAFFVIAPGVSALTGQATEGLIQLASAGFVVAAAATVPVAILNRRLNFRQLALNELVATSTGILATVALAVAGLEGAAIILGIVIATIVNTGLAFLTAPAVLPLPVRGETPGLMRFALPVQGASAVYAVQRYGAVSVVGGALGAATAGFFQRAYALAMEYQTKVSSILLTVAFPVYSRVDDVRRAIDLRRRITRAHASVLFPFLLLVAAEAQLLVPWLYGARWEPAADPTTVLAFAGLGAALLTGTGPIMLAIGRPNALFGYNVAATVVLVAALLVGSSFGLMGACIAFLGFQLVNVTAVYVFLLRRFLGVGFRELRYDCGPALAAGVVLFGLAAGCSYGLDSAGVATFVNLMISTGVGLAAYCFSLRFAFTDAWSDLLLMIRRVVPVPSRT